MQLTTSYPFSKGTISVVLVVSSNDMVGDEADSFMMDDMLKEVVRSVTAPLVPSLNHLDRRYEVEEGTTVVDTLFVQELLDMRVELRVEVTLDVKIAPKLVQAVVATSVMTVFADYAVQNAASRVYRSLEDDTSVVPKMDETSNLARFLGGLRGDGGAFDALLGDEVSPTL